MPHPPWIASVTWRGKLGSRLNPLSVPIQSKRTSRIKSWTNFSVVLTPEEWLVHLDARPSGYLRIVRSSESESRATGKSGLREAATGPGIVSDFGSR